MIERSLSILALMAFASAAHAASAEPLRLEPSSDWQLREYDDKCRVIRTFGEGEDEVTLWLEKAGAGRFVNVTLIGQPFRNPYGARVTLAFPPGAAISRGFISTTSSTGRSVLSMFGVAPISFDREPRSEANQTDGEETVDLSLAGGTDLAAPEVIAARYEGLQAIELSGALIQKVSLQTGGIAAIMAQLQQCADEIPGRRSKAPAGVIRAGTAARDRDTANWARQIQANYPSYLLREMAEGTVGVRVQINPEGRATYCEVVEHTGPAGLNDAACQAMIRYARFDPATDRDGNAVWGSFSTKVTYRIN